MKFKIITLLALCSAFLTSSVFGQEKPIVIKFENTIIGNGDGEQKDEKKPRGNVRQKIEVNIKEVNIFLGAKAPKVEPVWITQPVLVHCNPTVVNGTIEYVRWSCGRSVVWFVAQPGKKPTTFYPPFLLRNVGKDLIAQEQLWTVEYVQVTRGKQDVIWTTQIRVKPDRAFKLPGKTAAFDVTKGFEGAEIKATSPFVLFAPADQAWWGTGVPGVGGRLEADVVAGYPLVLRLPCSGQAMFEGAGGKQLGPVIVNEK